MIVIYVGSEVFRWKITWLDPWVNVNPCLAKFISGSLCHVYLHITSFLATAMAHECPILWFKEYKYPFCYIAFASSWHQQ